MLAKLSLGRRLVGGATIVGVLFVALTFFLVGQAASLRDSVEDARLVALEAMPADATADAAEVALAQVSHAAQQTYRRARNTAVGGGFAIALVGFGLLTRGPTSRDGRDYRSNDVASLSATGGPGSSRSVMTP